MVIEIKTDFIAELERSSYDDMVSIPSSGGTLHLNTSQLTPDFRQRGHSSSSLSPGSPCSWKNSLEELSKGLQRICSSSPNKEPNSPLPKALLRERKVSNASLPKVIDSDAGNRDTVKRQTSDNVFNFSSLSKTPFCTSLPDGTKPIRVRHDETQDTLQKRLSQISGYNLANHLSRGDMGRKIYSHQRKPSKDLALMVARRLSATGNRLNISVDVKDTKHDDLTVSCHDGKLTVSDCSKKTDNNEHSSTDEVHKESLPTDTQVNRIMCALSEQTLHIRERSKPVMKLETSASALEDRVFCPVFTNEDDGKLWKMSWYLEDKYINQNITIKTVDSKLIIVCRSKRLSMLMNHMEMSQDLIRNSFNQNGPVAMRYRGGIQLTLDLPDGVDSRSVSSYVTDGNQLIVQGRQMGNFERCMTL